MLSLLPNIIFLPVKLNTDASKHCLHRGCSYWFGLTCLHISLFDRCIIRTTKLARYRIFNTQVASLLTYKHVIIFLAL